MAAIKVSYEVKSIRKSNLRDLREVQLERVESTPEVGVMPGLILHVSGDIARDLAVGERFSLVRDKEPAEVKG